MAKLSPSVVGARAEMAVASALQRVGTEVFVPLFAAHSRVDLVAVSASGLLRVQCKSARLVGGSLVFATCSHTHNVSEDYRDQIDAFGVFSADLSLVYMVPVEEAPLRGCTLRLEPARNGQRAGVRWGSDYLVGPP
jgi:hypothetical protein